MSKDRKIIPHKLHGIITSPPSKSVAHRAIICASFAKGISHIHNIDFSDDIVATIGAVRALGAKVEMFEDSVIVDGTDLYLQNNARNEREMRIECNESGSTMRFFIPIAFACGGKLTMTGGGQLGIRPIDAFYPVLEQDNATFQKHDRGMNLLFEMTGKMRGGIYEMPGNVSSQYITGLLLAASLLPNDTEILLTTPLESKGYIDLTLQTMHEFGVVVENMGYTRFFVKGGQTYLPQKVTVESDYSQAAFFFVAAALGNPLTICGMNPQSAQGDRAVVETLQNLGYIVLADNNGLCVESKSPHGTTIDGSECPDIIPVLAVLAALTPGRTEVVGAERLRIKECDRIKAMVENLEKLGANITERQDGLVIEGVAELNGGTVVDSFGDHRIAMCMAIASTRCKEAITLRGAESVRKSYPRFWQDFERLGGCAIYE